MKKKTNQHKYQDMDKNSSKLRYSHISRAATEIVEYIKDRSKGVSESLKTKWGKFNKLCMGGIEPNTIYTIAGVSGSGEHRRLYEKS